MAMVAMTANACASSGSRVPQTSSTDLSRDPTNSESFGSCMKVGDRCFQYFVTGRNVANTPYWDPESGRPPVSLKRAINISKAEAARISGNPDTLFLDRVALYQ